MRKPFQGLSNVIRFNYPFYLYSSFLLAFLTVATYNEHAPKGLFYFLIALISVPVLTSLIITCYIYDFSDLYRLNWSKKIDILPKKILNIHAGFDEISELLHKQFPAAELTVYDFYDPEIHTEKSILRARKAYPAFKNTIGISTRHVPSEKADLIVLMLSAHEIRKTKERIHFFRQLKDNLTDKGKIVVTEHLRNNANFVAYSIGAFHFYSKKIWLQTFCEADLTISNIFSTTPFITTFILTKNGSSS